MMTPKLFWSIEIDSKVAMFIENAKFSENFEISINLLSERAW